MSAATATLTLGESGQWRVIARPAGHSPVDVSWFRGAPTSIGDWEREDPFGPKQLELTFPAVTIFDRRGAGELYWLYKHVDIDLEWVGALPAGYPYDRCVHEFYVESFAFSRAGVTVTLKGALYQLDNPLAKPEYPPAPLPYEYAIARQFTGRPDLRTAPLRVEWPDWWDVVYAPDPQAPAHMIPMGASAGQKWSGLVTRRTGSWEPVLTSYVQTLLSGMYTHRGRFTVDLRPGRRPVLCHRDIKYEPDEATVVIDINDPSVDFDLNEDWSQSIGVVYGQGTSLQGVGFSGMQVAGDGSRTVYKPLAALRHLDPVTDDNGWLNPSVMRKEVVLQVPQGLSERQARRVAVSHLQHFADPGLQGTVTLTGDPRLGEGGDLIPRSLLLEGMTVQVKGVFGLPAGILMHSANVKVSLSSGAVTLTLDSKFRDALTLDEVRLRGRDALSITRQLVGGLYEPPIPDQLVPWNYAEGSGFIPSSEKRSAQRLFDGMPEDIEFPWSEWTTARPPRSAAYKDCYIKIDAANAVRADKNWALNPDRDSSAGAGYGYGFGIRMAQQGSVRLLQLAAYDADGNVMAVPFHFSLYYSPGVSVQAMPRIPASQSGQWGPEVPPGFVVDTNHLQHYPFHDNAWERFNSDGTQRGIDVVVSTETAGLVRGWGTGPAKAGYWPGSSGDGDEPTGLLVDERTWEFNPYTDPNAANAINPYSTIQRAAAPGFLYGMIYCDAQGAEPVYFAGRMFRVEPGTSV